MLANSLKTACGIVLLLNTASTVFSRSGRLSIMLAWYCRSRFLSCSSSSAFSPLTGSIDMVKLRSASDSSRSRLTLTGAVGICGSSGGGVVRSTVSVTEGVGRNLGRLAMRIESPSSSSSSSSSSSFTMRLRELLGSCGRKLFVISRALFIPYRSLTQTAPFLHCLHSLGP